MTAAQTEALERVEREVNDGGEYPVIKIVDVLDARNVPFKQHVLVNIGPGAVTPPQTFDGRDDEDLANRVGYMVADILSPSGHGQPDVTVKWIAIEEDGTVLE